MVALSPVSMEAQSEESVNMATARAAATANLDIMVVANVRSTASRRSAGLNAALDAWAFYFDAASRQAAAETDGAWASSSARRTTPLSMSASVFFFSSRARPPPPWRIFSCRRRRDS